MHHKSGWAPSTPPLFLICLKTHHNAQKRGQQHITSGKCMNIFVLKVAANARAYCDITVFTYTWLHMKSYLEKRIWVVIQIWQNSILNWGLRSHVFQYIKAWAKQSIETTHTFICACIVITCAWILLRKMCHKAKMCTTVSFIMEIFQVSIQLHVGCIEFFYSKVSPNNHFSYA